jgi:intein/homing endonuclease
MLKLSPELAEFLGILIGDGYFDVARNRVIISGNLRKDAKYLTNYVKPLIEDLFSVRTISWKQENKGAKYLCFYSKPIIAELKRFDLKKTDIPKSILRGSKNAKASFLRGLADTDFSVYLRESRKNYPNISSTFSSGILVLQIKKLLKEFGIRANIYFQRRLINDKFYNQYNVHIYGKKNLDLWLKEIGFRNERNLSKIRLLNSKVKF